MKVTFEENYKNFYTVNEYEQAKQVITQEKEDEETPKGWAQYAITEALKNDYEEYDRRIIEATAETRRNSRAWDAYFEGSGHMDVLIEALAETDKGYIKVRAFLTDIWQSGAVDYRQYMTVERFRRA